MAEVFQPIRTEPFFEPIPDFDVSKLKITVVWANYLDSVGNEINEASTVILDSSVTVEASVSKLTGITQGLNNQIEDLTHLISDLLTKDSSLRGELEKLRKRIDDLESEHAN